jgi:hypothetical protein
MEGCLYIKPDYEIKTADVLLTPQDTGILWLVSRKYDNKPDMLVVPLTDFDGMDVTDVKEGDNPFIARCNSAMFINEEYMRTVSVVADNWPDLTIKVRAAMHTMATGGYMGEDSNESEEETEYDYHIREVNTYCDLLQNRSFSLDSAGK